MASRLSLLLSGLATLAAARPAAEAAQFNMKVVPIIGSGNGGLTGWVWNKLFEDRRGPDESTEMKTRVRIWSGYTTTEDPYAEGNASWPEGHDGGNVYEMSNEGLGGYVCLTGR
jgi:hypothetical protein